MDPPVLPWLSTAICQSEAGAGRAKSKRGSAEYTGRFEKKGWFSPRLLAKLCDGVIVIFLLAFRRKCAELKIVCRLKTHLYAHTCDM